MEQEKQRQPQENSQKELLWKPPSGWRYYSPTHRSGWRPTGRQILATIAIVASVSLILIDYFSEQGPGRGHATFYIGAIGAITLVVIGLWKAKRLPTRVWKAIRGNAASAGVLVALLAAIFGLSGVLYQQRVASDIADQQRQETQVQTYFDDMGELLLDTDQPLREAVPGDDVSVLAQAKTLTILEALDSRHKRSIVRFLYNAQLVLKDAPVVSLRDADLRDANLIASDLRDADLSSARLPGAELMGAKLTAARLNSAQLPGAKLMGADLSSAQLPEADLSSAQLPEANLISADLSGANLNGADLSGARLVYADLSGARLIYADLRDADLRDADLRDADLRDADLSRAHGITSEDLEKQSRSLEGATMPDGSTHE